MVKPSKRLLLKTNNYAVSDNTRVSRPVLPVTRKINQGETVIYKYKKGLRFPTGVIRSKNEVVSQDNRSSYQKRQDDIALQNVKRRIHEQQNYQNAVEGVSAISKLVSPSTYVGAAANALTGNGDFKENLVSGEGFGDTTANTMFDLAIPFTPKLSKNIPKTLIEKSFKNNFNAVPSGRPGSYTLLPIKGSRFDDYNNYIYNMIGANPSIPDIEAVMPNHMPIGIVGLHYPSSGKSLINIIASDKLSTAVHEGVSHGTDRIVQFQPVSRYIPMSPADLSPTVGSYYQKMADELGHKMIINQNSAKWNELRATLNEFRFGMKKNIDDISDKSIIWKLGMMNDYGKDYAIALMRMNRFNRKNWLNQFRNAVKYLPAAVPAITYNNYGKH